MLCPPAAATSESALYIVLAAYVGKVGVVFHAVCVANFLARVDFRIGSISALPLRNSATSRRFLCAVHLKRVYGSCLAGVVASGTIRPSNFAVARACMAIGNAPRMGRKRSVDPQLAYEHVALQAVAVHSSLCRRELPRKRGES